MHADMFEHADGDDAVEPALDLAIVDQLELDPVADTQDLGAPPGHRQLPFRQGDAHHFDIGDMGEIEAQPAPAAADVEQPLAVCQLKLGGEMTLLQRLRLLERLGAIGKIGAGILHVGIEKEPVDFLADVVMRLHIAARPRQTRCSAGSA